MKHSNLFFIGLMLIAASGCGVSRDPVKRQEILLKQLRDFSPEWLFTRVEAVNINGDAKFHYKAVLNHEGIKYTFVSWGKWWSPELYLGDVSASNWTEGEGD